MNIEDKIAKIVKENAGSMMHPKGHVVLTLDPQDLKDLTKSLVKNLGLFSVSRCFSSKEQLQSYITTHIPIAVKPIKPAKTTFVNPFTSNNARQIVEDAIVECLLKNG